MVSLVLTPDRVCHWKGKKGAKFAIRIGNTMRQFIVAFIEKHTTILPVHVCLTKLSRSRMGKVYPVTIDGIRKIAFTVGKFFLLINYDAVTPGLQNAVGEISYSMDELMNATREDGVCRQLSV